MKKNLFLFMLTVGSIHGSNLVKENMTRDSVRGASRFLMISSMKSKQDSSERLGKDDPEQKQFQHDAVKGSVKYYRPIWSYETFHGLMQDKYMRTSFLNKFFLDEGQKLAQESFDCLSNDKEEFPVHLGLDDNKSLLSINVIEADDDLSQLRNNQKDAHSAFVRRYMLTESGHSYNRIFGLDLSITSKSVDPRYCYYKRSLASERYPRGVHFLHRTIDPEMARKYGDWGVLFRSSSLTPSHARLLISDKRVLDAFNNYFTIK